MAAGERPMLASFMVMPFDFGSEAAVPPVGLSDLDMAAPGGSGGSTVSATFEGTGSDFGYCSEFISRNRSPGAERAIWKGRLPFGSAQGLYAILK
ncbi:hypothetical protein OWV82_019395 [Melia azedarach]|uniref:Uncharacterized protein n=1 Tax=Melia azedarach TaxID=155640 RepID=A0ACC1XEA3_MELAZ|nr:hypothetical protein OWV82_019395 [Melia azedarach]